MDVWRWESGEATLAAAEGAPNVPEAAAMFSLTIGLSRRCPRTVEINPLDARELGIVNGDRVRIASRSGSAEGIAKVSPRVRPGVIAGTHHFGTPRRALANGRSPAVRSTRSPVDGPTTRHAESP